MRRIAYHNGINGAFTDDLHDLPPDSQHEPEVWASTTHLSNAQGWMARRRRGWKLPTFVVGWMRDPLARCMSSYYFFHLCRQHNNTSTGSDQVSGWVVAHLGRAGGVSRTCCACTHVRTRTHAGTQARMCAGTTWRIDALLLARTAGKARFSFQKRRRVSRQRQCPRTQARRGERHLRELAVPVHANGACVCAGVPLRVDAGCC